jgi:ribosomal protein S18 acetylase RimI-like enzyme
MGGILIQTAEGVVRLRSERESDEAFRYRLFCQSRPPEWDQLQAAPVLWEQLTRHQFGAQNVGYRSQFPEARFDIIELAGEPIGRIVVDRPGNEIHLVDQAIVPTMRNRGVGTAIMRHLLDEAEYSGLPVRLFVSSGNDPSLRLYLRLGFVPIQNVPAYIELQWRAKG